ncbi:MAG: ABC transporter permease [Candidatus Micrarchaeia archaeon]|jgi:ABC-2 type transport system permease protein
MNSLLKGIYIIWLREVRLGFRDRVRLVSSLLRLMLWLFAFGSGMSAAQFAGLETGYASFLLPGILVMSVMFTAVFSGFSVIWDRDFGFLKEMLVSPVSRNAIVLGKSLGVGTLSLAENAVVMLFAFAFGYSIDAWGVLPALAALFLLCMASMGLGLIVVSLIDSAEAFGGVVNLLILPLFFTSGALFPLDSAPAAMKTIALFNPFTYGADLVRGLLLDVHVFPLEWDLALVSAFAIVMLYLGRRAFQSRL